MSVQIVARGPASVRMRFVPGLVGATGAAGAQGAPGPAGPIAVVSTLAALQAVTGQVAGSVVVLTASDRAGQFVWTTGDQSGPITLDPRSGCYVKADAVAATAGAWVRVGPWATTGVYISWFGLTFVDDTAAIQAALNFANNVAIKVVRHGSQALTFSSLISVPAGVKLIGNKLGSFTQKTGTNLGDLVSLGAGAEFSDIILDANWLNNPTSLGTVAIRIGNSDDCTVTGNVIKNVGGYPVVINNGLRAKVQRNEIFNFYSVGIQVYGGDLAGGHDIDSNYVHDIGWGGFGCENTNFVKFTNNRLIGQLYGRPGSRATVNTSGSTVTWASGPNFSGLRKGNWIVLNGGGEWRITNVVSNTQITVDITTYPATTLPTLTGTPAIFGSGDLCGIVQSSYCEFAGNLIKDTTTYGFGYSLGATNALCSSNTFRDNTVISTGKNAICADSRTSGTGFLENNSILNNKIIGCGNGAGIGAIDQIAIFVQFGAAGTLGGLHISGNQVTSYAGDGQTTYWLGTSGGTSFGGTVTVTANTTSGIANGSTIYQGIAAITLSAGWGTGAAVAGTVTDGKSVSFTVTAGSSGTAALAMLTVNKIVETSAGAPYPIAKNVTSGTGVVLATLGEQVSTRGSWVAYTVTAPAASGAYTFFLKD